MTDLSPREKALVEAARLAMNRFRHLALDAAADDLEPALRAYDPPKPDADVLAVRAILHAEQRALMPTPNDFNGLSVY